MAIKRGGLGKGLDSLIPKKIKKREDNSDKEKQELPAAPAKESEEGSEEKELSTSVKEESVIKEKESVSEIRDIEKVSGDDQSASVTDEGGNESEEEQVLENPFELFNDEDEEIFSYNNGNDDENGDEGSEEPEEEAFAEEEVSEAPESGNMGESEEEMPSDPALPEDEELPSEKDDKKPLAVEVRAEYTDESSENAFENGSPENESGSSGGADIDPSSSKGNISEEKTVPADDVSLTAPDPSSSFLSEPMAAEPSEGAGISDGEMVSDENAVVMLRISLVEPNRQQPRKKFKEETIEELAESIRNYGIIQPLLVQKKQDYYEIIAGERRWRAARKAGLREVPVIIRDYTSQEAAEVALIENIQREDLNPIEEAQAYDRLIREFSLTQEEVAGKVARSRSSITNSLRLLRLCEEVRDMVIRGDISEGHARAILGLSSPAQQKMVAEQIAAEKLSVRETEKLVRRILKPAKEEKKEEDLERKAVLRSLGERLTNVFGTQVLVSSNAKGKGKIEIDFYSDEELDRIYELLSSAR